MSIVAMNGSRKMTKVLDQLNKAVQDKKSEIEQNLAQFKKITERKLEDAKETIVETAASVDKEVHANPWAYIGGAAAFALLAGFITGRLTKK